MDASGQPIVIKKIRKRGHGGGSGHGSSWKVAYADFVTAMMAFFLLLWLLNTMDQEEKAGISDYFQAPSGLIVGRGASDSPVDRGGVLSAPKSRDAEEYKAEIKQFEKGGSGDAVDRAASEALRAAEERERLEQLEAELAELIEANEALRPYKEQLLIDITSEGLRIQIVDKENRLMFDSGSAELKPYTRDILRALGQTIDTVPNRISLTGHTDASRFSAARRGYSNWELSADRANASRRELIAGGLSEGKVAKVVGLADNMPFKADEPLDPVNRRIAIIVMNRAAEAALRGEHSAVQSSEEAQQLLRGEPGGATEPPSAAPDAGAAPAPSG